MSMARFITVVYLLALMGCASDRYAEQRGLYPDNYYEYTNLRGPLEYIYIINDSADKSIVYVDEEVGREIQRGASGVSPTILAFDRPHHVVFYLPKDFDEEMKEWEYMKCHYKVISYGYGFRPRANREVHDYLIEQRCDDDPKVVRYEYADYYGLQSFGVGEYKGVPNGETIFELEDAYALFGAEIGFGAREN